MSLRLSLISVFSVMLLTAVSCSHVSVEKNAIYDGGSFELYTDSLVRDGRIYMASDLRPARSEIADSLAEVTAYHSDCHVADALFARSLADSSALTVTDVGLSAAFLRPEESLKLLRSTLEAGRLPAEKFPEVTDIGSWAVSAWEVYCVTGSKAWLKEAYEALTAYLHSKQLSGAGCETPLVCGQPEQIADAADFYPAWMEPMDRYETFATSVNLSQATGFEIASRMARELRLYAEREHLSSFTDLRNAVNDRLWIPSMQHYGQYLYGEYYPILSTVADNRANALCVLNEIATPEMAAALIAATPVCRGGVPELSPRINPGAHDFDPVTQALFALAAAKVRNPQAFLLAAASLMDLIVDRRSVSEWPAVVCKGLFGMNFTTSGIYFSPMVPAVFDGPKKLSGFRYRDAVLDISMSGTGDRIASFMVDSVSTGIPRIDSTLKGHHKIEIILSGNALPERGVNVVEQTNLPPVPQLRWDHDGRGVKILNFDPSLRYGVYLNGTMTETLPRENYRLPSSGVSVTQIVPMLADGQAGFSPRGHVYAPGQSEIIVRASSVTPRRPPLHFIKDRRTADDYIELAARHNTRITCYANVPVAGEYFLTVGYSNGSVRTARRVLSINDRDVATVICPALSQDDWITVRPSNTVVVSLREGPNKIALTYIEGTMLLNKITLLKKAH